VIDGRTRTCRSFSRRPASVGSESVIGTTCFRLRLTGSGSGEGETVPPDSLSSSSSSSPLNSASASTDASTVARGRRHGGTA
jgi:hypothetical protein